MKYGFNKILGISIYIGFALLIVFTFSCCRSNKQSSRSIQTHTEKTDALTETRTDSTRTERTNQDSTVTVVNTSDYSRTTTYRNDGGISSIQEQWRDTGSAQLSVSTGRTSEVSVTEEKTDSTSTIKEQLQETKEIKSTIDNRPIQGGDEWFGVIIGLAISVILIITGIVIYIKKKKKT